MECSERRDSAHVFIEISGAPDHNDPAHRQEPDCKNERCCSVDHLILPWPCPCKPTGAYHNLPCGLRRASTYRGCPGCWSGSPRAPPVRRAAMLNWLIEETCKWR